MNLEELWAENLYSFKSLHLPFKEYQKGVTVFLGKNLDMNSPNGAGKSSIFKILYYALWGRDLKNTPLGKITRRNSSKGHLVRLIFTDMGIKYQITRYRSYKGDFKDQKGKKYKGTGIEFLIDGVPLVFDADSAGIQQAIESKLGMSPKIFLNSVFTAQKRDSYFLKENDSKKKELLGEILDLGIYEKAYKIATKEFQVLESRLEWLTMKLETILDKIKDRKELLQSVQKKEQEQHLNFKKEKEIIQKRKKNNEEKIKQIQVQKSKISIKDTQEAQDFIEKINLRIEKTKKKLSKQEELQKIKNQIESKIYSNQELLKKYLEENEDLKEEIKELTKKIEALKLSDVKNIENSLVDEESKLEQIEKNQKDFNETLHLIERIKDSIKNQEEESKSVLDDLTKINSNIEKVKNESMCHSCLRNFKEGESSSLDTLLNKEKLLAKRKQEQLDKILITLENKQKEYKKIENKKNKIEFNEKLLVEQKNIVKAIRQNLEKENNKINSKKIMEEQKSSYVKKQEKLTISIDTIEKQNKSLEEKQNKITPVLQELNKFQEELQILKEGLKKQEDILNAQSLAQEKIQNLENQINSLKKENELLKLPKSVDYLQDIQKYESDIISLEEETLNYKKEQKTKIKEREDLRFWVQAFSKTGISSYIIDDIIEVLNEKANDNLDLISDGMISVLFNSETTDSKGNVNNKINTQYFINGEETLLSLNSGGEEERAALAVDLALSDIAETRSGTKFNLKFLDEPFDGIASSDEIKCLALFKKLSENKTGFFIISHNETLQSFSDNTIYVIKENGVSKIVDKSEFSMANIGAS